jgi:enoyl-CoA hydratase
MKRLATIEFKDAVSVLTLDDGKVNPFSFDMIDEIDTCLDRVPTDRGALLIAGRPGVLSAGFDLDVVRGGSNQRLLQLVERGVGLLMRVAQFPRPVVVESTGHAVALGAFLLLVADWRVGARGDFRIGLNEVKNGLPLPSCFRAIARNRIPPNWFDRAYLHAELYAPDEAIAPGFLDEVVTPETLHSVALAQAERLAGLPSPAYGVAKELDRKPFAEKVMLNFHADALQAFAATLPETLLKNSPAA